jgi:hypothetical protein
MRHSRVAPDCSENGSWCDSEEANEWIEDEFWIFTGGAWFCIDYKAHPMCNLK